MGVLAPLFLGGLALLVLPWFIHRIRRPERETLKFSSLMFVPNIKQEVIERRRVQHILLMLLRMALLLVLALAFMRPFLEVVQGVETPKAGATFHAIVLDASLSMATHGHWDAAKKQAWAVLGNLKSGDRVGVIVCGEVGEVMAPLSEDIATAQQAIDAAAVRWEKLDFAMALQSAEHMLSVDAGEDVRRVVHLVSDFQASGMPTGDANWRLPAGIAFDARVVGDEGGANVSVDALTVRAVNDSLLQVRARVKTWSGNGDVVVRLTVGGVVKDTREMTIPAGNASQAVFTLPRVADAVTGSVEVLVGDALSRDDQRFFVYQADPPHQVAVLPSAGQKNARSFDRLIEATVPRQSRLPWRVEVIRDFEQALSSKPNVMIAADVMPERVNQLTHYMAQGGKVLLVLNAGTSLSGVNALLLRSGVQVGPMRFAQTRVSTFEPMAWVDLTHPMFVPFNGARFNDFSSVRYYNYYTTTVDSSAGVIARFEDGSAAMIDVPVGLGRVVIWTGGVELEWSNLARSPRFVPLMHEALRYLAGAQVNAPVYAVGDAVPDLSNLVQPDRDHPVVDGAFVVPGLYRWTTGRLAAVNVDATESDPTRVSPAELEIRLAQAPVLYRGTHALVSLTGEQIQREEFGYWGIVVLFVLLLIEQWVSLVLRTQHSRETAS